MLPVLRDLHLRRASQNPGREQPAGLAKVVGWLLLLAATTAVAVPLRATVTNPQRAEDYVARSIVRYREGNTRGALEDLMAGLSREPYHTRGLLLRGCIREAMGDHPGAKVDWANASFSIPWDPSAMMRAPLFQDGYPSALHDIEQVTNLFPRSSHAFYHRAMVKLMYEHEKEALVDFQRAVELDPANYLALYGRGIVRTRQGDFPGALADLNRALILNRKAFPHQYDGRIDYALGEAKLESGDVLGAESDFHMARALGVKVPIQLNPDLRKTWSYDDNEIAQANGEIARNPHDVQALLRRAQAERRKGARAGELADFTAATQAAPNDPALWYRRGYRVLCDGDFTGAIADFSQTLRLDPRSVDAWTYRGLARNRLKDFAGAVADCDHALRLKPANKVALTERGIARFNLGDFREAISDYDVVLRIEGPDYCAHERRGDAHKMLGEYAEAMEDYRQAQDPPGTLASKSRSQEWALKRVHVQIWGLRQHAPAMERLNAQLRAGKGPYQSFEYRGLLRWQAGDLKGAHEDFSTLTKAYPRSAQAFYHRGLVLESEGDSRQALNDYVTALALRQPALPDFPDRAVLVPEDTNTCHLSAAAFRADLPTLLSSPEEERKLRIHIALLLARLDRADPWPRLQALAQHWPTGAARTTVEFLAGATPEKEFLAGGSADGPKDHRILGETCYYAGMRQLLVGNPAGAREFFQRAVTSGAAFAAERNLARAELEALSHGHDQTPD